MRILSTLLTRAPPTTSETDEAPATLEDAAQLDFAAYNLPDPIKTPQQ
ncbi:hypothetical protein MKK84_00170 [Methylobacterium sp. E-065]|nr:hypothetical protein [Methylobacterium sp. E-065]MCJ2015855.1 hypothetical protein [Methylobacterium sp. E-065]